LLSAISKALGPESVVVARVWAKHGLKPQRLDRYMATNDPDFEKQAADILGLYLNPARSINSNGLK